MRGKKSHKEGVGHPKKNHKEGVGRKKGKQINKDTGNEQEKRKEKAKSHSLYRMKK